MKQNINRVAILGSGVMGSGIAGLLAGAGIHVLLLDIVPNELTEEEKAKGLTEQSIEFRNRFSQKGKDYITDPKSGVLFEKSQAAYIEIGNMTDDMHKLSSCDWVIEVVVERLDVKRSVMQQIEKYRKPGSIISTNTSGVSISAIADGMSEEFRQHFLGTHFFNPPRYMKLFEMIPLEDTLKKVVSSLEEFAQDELGKGVVYAKDTPNFIGNRIGVYSVLDCMRQMQRYGYNIPTIDSLTGPVIGRPKSASFRTADMSGLDILVNVAKNVQNNIDDDKENELYSIPQFVLDLVSNGALGDKAKHGFYKKEVVNGKKVRLAFDLETGTYQALVADDLQSVNESLKSSNKYATMAYGDNKENHFVWDILKNVLLYSANNVPNISDDFVMIDKAMVWGYNWEKGPFQIWDELGLERSVKRMQEEGNTVPTWVLDKLSNGEASFYENVKQTSPYIQLDHKKHTVVNKNDAASILDIGNDILCLELHSKGNAIGEATMDMLETALEALDTGKWQGLVIGSMGKNFSAGADLSLIANLAQTKQWDKLNTLIAKLQRATTALKYSSRPVVAAPFGMTLGGGAEIAMHTTLACPHAETYIGLVEAGVGLLPAGGGTKEMLVNTINRCSEQTKLSMLPAIKKSWRTLATAQVSAGGFDAISKGFLSKNTHVIMNKDAIISKAKLAVMQLNEWNYHPSAVQSIKILGDYGRASIEFELEAMLQGNFISEHDALIAKKIAYVMTGGNLPAGTVVSESYILDLEREAFLSLSGEEKTQQRIIYMLTNGKPLRN